MKKIWELWEKLITVLETLFSKLFEDKKPQTATPAQVLKPLKENHDYGLQTAEILLASGDYGWETKTPKKTLILANTDKCANKLTLMGMVAQWHGTGHAEWECLLAAWLINAVKDATEAKEAADITHLFNVDLTSASGTMSQKEICRHLAPHFKKVSEFDNTLYVELINPQ